MQQNEARIPVVGAAAYGQAVKRRYVFTVEPFMRIAEVSAPENAYTAKSFSTTGHALLRQYPAGP
jgi:hypothetical protein